MSDWIVEDVLWERLVYTGADDCRTSLRHFTKEGLPVLKKALAEAEKRKYKTITKLITSRIRQLEKQNDITR